jgi:2-amino-4-hydroxy-6-hydroxymethyldihydropteridine diphosphokinase
VSGLHPAVVSLGANLGDRVANLRLAVQLLTDAFGPPRVSPVYESDPVGVTGQPPYLNVVALLDVPDAYQLLDVAADAERQAGRVRGERWAARPLDVDVVAVGAMTSADPRLTLPHPRAHERAFVLVPWCDLDPGAVLPGRGPIAELLDRLPAQGIQRVADRL